MGSNGMVFNSAIVWEKVVRGEVGETDRVVDEESKSTPTRPTGTMSGDECIIGDGSGVGGKGQFGLLQGCDENGVG